MRLPTCPWKGPDVTPRFLMIVFDSTFLIAMTAWVGSILFVSFAVAPIIFNVLGAEAGGKFVRALFPRYYTWGAVSGSVALPAAVGVPLCYPEMRGPWIAVEALVIIAGVLVMLYCGNSLTPAISAARDLGPTGHGQFERLHRRSVRLNAFVLVLGLGLIVAFTVRPAPKTSGIVELTPQQRVDRELEWLRQHPEGVRPSSPRPAR